MGRDTQRAFGSVRQDTDSRGMRIPQMNTLRSMTCGMLVLILLAPTAAFAQSQLPKPSGKYGVGKCVLDWIDYARTETQSGKQDAKRELLVYLFYPIDPQTQGVRAEYFPRLKEMEAYEERFGKNFTRESYGDSYKTISTIKSHAITNAPVVAGKGQFPVLIFSHGGGNFVLHCDDRRLGEPRLRGRSC